MIRLKANDATKQIVRVRQKNSSIPHELVAVKIRKADGSVKTLHTMEYYPREPIQISSSIITADVTLGRTASYLLVHVSDISEATKRQIVPITASLLRGNAVASGIANGSKALAYAKAGAYALFAGGIVGSIASAYAEAVSDALVVSTPTALSAARGYAAGASVGSYALFAGGASDTAVSTTVNAYTTALVRSTPTALGTARRGAAGVSGASMAMIAGGLAFDGYTKKLNVDLYTTALVRSSGTSLGNQASSTFGVVGAAALTGGFILYALFGNFEIYNPSGVKQTTIVCPLFTPGALQTMCAATLEGQQAALFMVRHEKNMNLLNSVFRVNSSFVFHQEVVAPFSFEDGIGMGIGKHIFFPGDERTAMMPALQPYKQV